MFYQAIPGSTMLTIITFIASFFLVIKNNYDQTDAGIRLVLIIAIISFLILMFVNTPLSETRYAFHIFPLLLLISLFCFYRFANILLHNRQLSLTAFLFITFFYLILSEDFGPNHLMNIDSKEINFRTDFHSRLERHYYPRWDVKGTANIVNRNAKPDDIIIINEPVVSYYLNRIDYFFEDYRSGRFGAVTTAMGTKERWTNAKLVYTIPSLMDILENSERRVWFIARDKIFFDELPFYENMRDYLFYTGIDGSTWVFLFTPKDH